MKSSPLVAPPFSMSNVTKLVVGRMPAAIQKGIANGVKSAAIKRLMAWFKQPQPTTRVVVVGGILAVTLGFGIVLFSAHAMVATPVCASVGAAGLSSGLENRESAQVPGQGDSKQSDSKKGDSGSDLVVDVSGSVVRPGVYRLPADARIADAIAAAQGVTEKADPRYLAKFVNGSLKVSDQQKIYLPSIEESASLISCEALLAADLTREGGVVIAGTNSDRSVVAGASGSSATTSSLLSINQASASELQSLPGIGTKRAQDIIENRPYDTIQDLVTQKIVTQNVFDDIQSLIEL